MIGLKGIGRPGSRGEDRFKYQPQHYAEENPDGTPKKSEVVV